jgi:hypothetical protein
MRRAANLPHLDRIRVGDHTTAVDPLPGASSRAAVSRFHPRRDEFVTQSDHLAARLRGE